MGCGWQSKSGCLYNAACSKERRERRKLCVHLPSSRGEEVGEAEARIRMRAGGWWGQSMVVPQGPLGNEPGLCNWMHWRGRSRSMLGCMWGFLPWLSWVMQTRLLKALSISYIHAPLYLWDHSGTSGTGVTISVTTGRVLRLSSFVRVSQKYQSGHPGT